MFPLNIPPLGPLCEGCVLDRWKQVSVLTQMQDYTFAVEEMEDNYLGGFVAYSSIWYSTSVPSEEGKGWEGAREMLSFFFTWQSFLILKEGFGIYAGGDIDWEINMHLVVFTILPLFAQIHTSGCRASYLLFS